ncbi:hypothetical protein GF406_05110 [candidate division KSB1 bacterium]|nr:hypothetical protein [candidate division KSB1 bacterium]
MCTFTRMNPGPLRLCPRTYRSGIYLLKGEGSVVRLFREVLDRSAIDAGPGSCAGSSRFPAPIAHRTGNPGDLLFHVF